MEEKLSDIHRPPKYRRQSRLGLPFSGTAGEKQIEPKCNREIRGDVCDLAFDRFCIVFCALFFIQSGE
jgi:hypothetical protein